MEVNNQWLKELGNDDELWPSCNRSYMPSVINFEYDILRSMAINGNLYGLLLQIKDVYELIMKIPCVMGLIIINQNSDISSEAFNDVMFTAVTKPMSMGDWKQIANNFVKKKNVGFLPEQLRIILDKTKEIYDSKILPEGKNIINWRNDTIGHGALRFEGDPMYKQEIPLLLTALKKYISGSVGKLYESVYIQVDGTKLIGDTVSVNGEGNVELCINGETYPVSEFIITRDLQCFFFNSYYLRKKKAQFSTFVGGKALLESREYFQRIAEKLERLRLEGHLFKQKITKRSEESLLECLFEPDNYVEPKGLINLLKEKMSSLEKGTILIQMERGTGKSAFTNQMSGLHNNEPLIKKSFSRIYHLSNAVLRGLDDFNTSLNFSFEHSYSKEDDLYSSEYEIKSFDLFDSDPSECLADFLNEFHELYEKDSTILVLDGIDELTEETQRIIDCIPSRDKLDDGVFVILLSRFADEDTVHSFGKRMIAKAIEKSDAVIQVHRTDPINTEVMEKYIGGKCSAEEKKALIQKSEYRFLYLKPYLLIGDRAVLNSNNETEFYRSFLDYLFSIYGEAGKNTIKEILTVFTLFPGITLDEYLKYLNLPSLTYSFIGVLNDLMPLLTVTRHRDGNQYAQADEAYNLFVLKEFSDTVKEVSDYFDRSLHENLKPFLEGSFDNADSWLFDHYNPKIDGPDISDETASIKDKIAFYGKNIIALYHRSNEDMILYSPYTFVLFTTHLGNNNISLNGYPLVLAKELSNHISHAVLKGMRQEYAGQKCDDALYDILRIQKPYPLMFVKRALKRFPSFEEVYTQYVSLMGKDPLTEQLFWIIDDFEQSAEVMNIIESKADLNEYIHYFFSKGYTYYYLDTMPDEEKLDEESLRLFEHHKPLLTIHDEEEYTDDDEDDEDDEMYRIAELKAILEEALEEVKNPATDFSRINVRRDFDKLNYVYMQLEEFKKFKELDEILKELHRSVYDRLNNERYPEYLLNIIEFNNLDDHSRLSSIIHAIYPEQGSAVLAEWADILYRKADPKNGRGAHLALWILGEVIEEFEKKDDIENSILHTEKYVYEYSMIDYFGRENYDKMSEELYERYSNHGLPILYCTNSVVLLISKYIHNNYWDKANQLMKHLDEVTPLVIEYADNNNLITEDFIEVSYFAFSAIKQSNVYRIDEKVLQCLRDRQVIQIKMFLKNASVRSDYSELNRMIDRYLKNETFLRDIKNLNDRSAELIHIIKEAAADTDPATANILDDEVAYVNERHKHYSDLWLKVAEDNNETF